MRTLSLLLLFFAHSAFATTCDQDLQSWKSPEHIALENKIVKSHDGAQAEVFQWMRRHPFRGIAAFYGMATKGVVSNRTARAWQNVPSWRAYHQAYADLAQLDAQEDYPAMKEYARRLDAIAAVLPEGALERAYYPFAGTDFYWARIFKQLTFEDIGYDQDFVRNMWWSPGDYSAASRARILSEIENGGVISRAAKPQFIIGEGNETRADNDYNRPDTTLIIKGGHSILPFLEKRFGEQPLLFGTAIFASPADDPDRLADEMVARGYRLVDSFDEPSFYAPYAMGLGQVYIFARK